MFHHIFKSVDQDKNGRLNNEEVCILLNKVLAHLKLDTTTITPQIAQKLMRKVDLNNDGEIGED